VLHGIDYEGSGESVQTEELNLFMGRTWVVSGWGRDRIGHLVSFSVAPRLVSDRMREAERLRNRLLEATRLRRESPAK
jgi:hypothetical protein